MPNISEKKRALRKQMGQLNRSFSDTYYSNKNKEITEALLEHALILNAKVILSYWSMPKEAGTHTLNIELQKAGKTIILPVINDNTLDLKVFYGFEKMKPEPKYGILEPQGEIFTDFGAIDLVIVPGVAFTKDGERCGHGKGYYDRLLPKISSAYTIGLGYKHQLVEDIPIDEFDATLNEVYCV
ncbi:MAG: 5-formyltetrahydrofolate cyclo-ligase [Bacteroidia bacterium]